MNGATRAYARAIHPPADRRHQLDPCLSCRDRGGVISYGSDTVASNRRAANYVDRILKGEKAR